MIEKCIICGKEFERDQGYSKGGKGQLKNVFCSLECRKNYKQNLLKGKTKTSKCSGCGEEFVAPITSSKNILCETCLQEKKKKERTFPKPKICKNCGKEYVWDFREDYIARKKPSRFCSRNCANSYSSKHTIGMTKVPVCPSCGESFIVSIHAPYMMKCEKCKKKNKKERKKIKEARPYKPEGNTLLEKFERSGAYKQKVKTLKKLGFDFENPDVKKEFLKIQGFLLTEFEINLKSAGQIEKENNLAQNVLATRYFKLFGIEKRNSSKAMSNAFFTGKLTLPQSSGEGKCHSRYHQD